MQIAFTNSLKPAPAVFVNGQKSDAVLYWFGFNGQEKDNEVYGEGKSLSFEFRNYDSRLGRWWGIDPLVSQFPWSSPYVFVENDVVRKRDIGGKYGSDGHYWTAYAMGIMIGLSNEDAIKWAIAAETYDNIVLFSSSIQRTTFIDRFTWLPNPLGTQQSMHGLTGGSSDEVKYSALQQILSGNKNASHLFGDAYAHAKAPDYITMYSPPLGHAGAKEDPDNIGKHPEQYLSYVKSFASTMKFVTGKLANIDMAVFEEVSKYQSKEVRTGILQSYIASNVGQQLTLSYSSDLEKALINLKIEYSITTKTETINNYKYGETYTITSKQINIDGE